MKIPAELTEKTPIAFFSAEYGIEQNLHLYAGGLGILAGDFILEAGAQGVPFVAIGLLYARGFSSGKKDQSINTPEVLHTEGFEVLKNDAGEPVAITVDVEDRILTLHVWKKSYGSATLYLLNAEIGSNTFDDRELMSRLYDPDQRSKMFQEFALGIGGVKLLRHLNIVPVVYHLNEGHTSFVALALAAEYLHDHSEVSGVSEALNAVRPHIVATKHTILQGAGIYFEREEFKRMVEHYFTRHRINLDEFFTWGTKDDPKVFSATRFLLKAARAGNAVSTLHAVFEKEKHPNSMLIPITNGVHMPRWRSPLWRDKKVEEMTDQELWSGREAARGELVRWVQERSGTALNPHALTLVWARRFASYKRPSILFSDVAKLKRLVSVAHRPMQIIMSGVAHEADVEGQRVMHEIIDYANSPELKHVLVYIPDYSISVAKQLVMGADVWLNTPLRGKEACGTSGMKAALNGVLQYTTVDGWIGEVDWRDKGWILSEENLTENLYRTLEEEIIPAFYTRDALGIPQEWVSRMRSTMGLIEAKYGADRMLTEYLEKLYTPPLSGV